jgi:polyhydroxyalkanoate synthase subunit PhaC
MNPLGVIDVAVDACANVFDMTIGGGLSDSAPTPSTIIDEGPQRTLRRYRLPSGPPAGAPVLLVPPLAAPASCFDLRAGCSLAEHLVSLGYRTYVVDYGPIAFADRDLGLEHWIDEVIPKAIAAASDDADGRPLHVIGWCLGGIMALLSIAAQPLPVASVELIASPFDFAQVRAATLLRQLAALTGGRLGTALYRTLGIAPAPLVSLGFRATAIDKLIAKPLTLARHIADRDLLAHIEAIDDYMAHMLAYPGRSFGQLYHRFFRVNDLADGCVELEQGRRVDLAAIRSPVLVVAGESDVLAPPPSVLHVTKLLTGAREVEAHTFPGGHLGVLTGRSARDTTWHVLDEFLIRQDTPRRASSVAARAAAG